MTGPEHPIDCVCAVREQAFLYVDMLLISFVGQALRSIESELEDPNLVLHQELSNDTLVPFPAEGAPLVLAHPLTVTLFLCDGPSS